MTPQPAHKTVSNEFPCRSFCETDIFSSPPHKRQGSSVCLLCSHVICAQKMPASQSPCQYIAGREGEERSGSSGKRRKKPLLHLALDSYSLASSLVGRCGSAAPTYRRRRRSRQDARAPLCSIGAARPQRPTIQSLEHDVPRTGTASPRHNKKATTDWSGRLENYFAAKAAVKIARPPSLSDDRAFTSTDISRAGNDHESPVFRFRSPHKA